MTYRQLTYEQRCQIKAFMEIGRSRKKIAEIIKVHRLAISWELRRNRGNEATAQSKLIEWRWKDVGRPGSGLMLILGGRLRSSFERIGVPNKYLSGSRRGSLSGRR